MNYILIAGAVVAGILSIKFSKSRNTGMSLTAALIGVILAGTFVYMTYFSESPAEVFQTLTKAEAYGTAKLIKDAAPDAKVILLSPRAATDAVNSEILETLKTNGIQNVEFISSMEGAPMDLSQQKSTQIFLEALKDISDGDTVYVRSLKLNDSTLAAFFNRNPKSKVLLYVNIGNEELNKFPGLIAQIQTNPDTVQQNLPSDPQKAFEQGFKVIK